jgi:hypothetical protein
MTCDESRAALIDALAMRRPITDAAVLAHIDSCAACRAARDEYDAMWRQLGDLAAPHPLPDARARFNQRLASAAHASADGWRRVRPWYVGAWAATILIAALGGFGAGVRRAEGHGPSPIVDTRGTKSTFLLLFHIDSTFRRGHTPAASAAILADYGRWADSLAHDGTLIGGEKLADSTAWFGPAHEIAAQGDHLAGFMLIRVKDRAQAEKVAATCPHLKYGGRIELRRIARS